MGNAISWALIGLLAGALGALALAGAAAFVFSIPQVEGAYAMGVAFFWMPLGTVAGGILGFVRR